MANVSKFDFWETDCGKTLKISEMSIEDINGHIRDLEAALVYIEQGVLLEGIHLSKKVYECTCDEYIVEAKAYIRRFDKELASRIGSK